MATSAIRGVKRSYKEDGIHWDELSCSHRVTSLWSAVAKKHEPPDRRFCRTCSNAIAPEERIPGEDSLFVGEMDTGFAP